MAEYKTPEALTMSIHAYIICVNIIFGAYLWEWAFSLDFDMLYVHRKKRFTLAAATYFVTRYMALGVWILGMRVTNVFTVINCTAWNYAVHIMAYSTASFSSLLLLLRVSALSSQNLFVMGFLWAFYAATWGTSIWAMYNSHAMLIPMFHICAPTNLSFHRVNSVMAFAFDGVCLILMMFYLLRSRASHAGSLWGFMLQQGFWYAVAIATTYIPVIVFLYIDLNDAISQIVNSFGLLIVTVAATRMHRALVLFHETSSRHNTSGSNQVSDRLIKFNVPSAARRAEPLSVAVSVDKFNDSETVQEGSYQMGKLDHGHGKRSVASLDQLTSDRV